MVTTITTIGIKEWWQGTIYIGTLVFIVLSFD